MAEEQRTRVGDRVTIYARGKRKTWVADFWLNGQHQRVSLKTQNKKVAVQAAVKLDAQLADGTYRRVMNTVTVAAARDDYLNHLETEGRARKTVVRYRGELTALVDFCQTHRATRLAQITPALFDRFRAERKKDHCAKTMYHEGIVCKQFLKWAESRHLIGQSPLKGYKLQEPPPRTRPVPSLQEVQRLLTASTPRQRILLAVLAFTGMRSGELQRLRKEDVDLEGNWIHIVSREGAETKTRQSRTVPIHPVLAALLKLHHAPKGVWFFAAEPSAKFPEAGHWINTKKLNERFQATVARLKLPLPPEGGRYTVHALRHFFETHCVNSGIPQRVIDTWLGHRSDRSMASVYYRLQAPESQAFMVRVPFGDGMSAADAGEEK